jgi:hypothetical protein
MKGSVVSSKLGFQKIQTFAVWSVFPRILSFAKKSFLVIFSFGVLTALQIASLEVCTRYKVFPLNGFYLTNLIFGIVTVGYFFVSKRVISISNWRSIAAKFKKTKSKEIPAVLLIVRRKPIEKPKSNSAAV